MVGRANLSQIEQFEGLFEQKISYKPKVTV